MVELSRCIIGDKAGILDSQSQNTECYQPVATRVIDGRYACCCSRLRLSFAVLDLVHNKMASKLKFLL